ncbi:MAG: hypothetical protein IPL64_15130 [Flavobacteriales bacterium]|jgi:hypothetical protein|nr:hypothetical protein [Flavobacteriales bacterium]MBK8533201.1 hypothetical protein [Flavobacteriales bacterium]HQV76616.1 hypothetical protein [Flavobacteriales bacterium]
MQIHPGLIVAGGIGQIFTALIYPYIRHRVFDWYTDVRKLKPLNQEIAKTYGRYIVGLNFGFGLMAVTIPNDLMNGTPLAVAITGLIAAYWIGKVITQFAYYPMYTIPPGAIFKWGGYGMNILFCSFAVLYAMLVYHNIALLTAS